MNKVFFLFFFFSLFQSFAQKTIDSIQKIEEVIIESQRLAMTLSKNSHTITVLDTLEIQQSPAESLDEILQYVEGIDIRRRGVKGMQSDLYIRGGNFEQTLLLIDGIKMEDPQTGHHTMNAMLPLETIQQIEIIKGPSARVYGQNAFTGAINLVTKNRVKDKLKLHIEKGSYTHLGTSIQAVKNYKNQQIQAFYSYNESDGYRENTDFKNHNVFVKSRINTKKEPINIISNFSDRKFGANNFYTNSPKYNEYEETQNILIGAFTKLNYKDLIIKPKLFWRRNKDIFLLKRQDPNFSRNLNISNKIGLILNTSYKSDYGTLGFGIEASNIRLKSNNLGDQKRTFFSTFIEHRFSFFDTKIDITPGVSVNYYSDFKWQSFPGIDLGIQLSKDSKLYWNIGKSYRVPTYTELFVTIPNYLSGNSNLKPEVALSQELGFIYRRKQLRFNIAAFSRKAKDLIDYTKEIEESELFVAQNIREIQTKGFEFNIKYCFYLAQFKQRLNLGNTYILDNYEDVNVFASIYLLNTSIKNHFVSELQTQFFKNLTQSIILRYVERPTNNYHVVDAKIKMQIDNFNLFFTANNIFNANYSEYNFVPMPKSNYLIGLSYSL